MSELIGVYKKQSVVERNWRSLKDKKLLINAIYLELPSRINALMWIMTTTLLIYTATEYQIRKKMNEQKLQYRNGTWASDRSKTDTDSDGR